MAKSTTTSSSDQSSRDSETSLPHSRTTAPSTPDSDPQPAGVGRHPAAGAASGPSDTARPMVSRPAG